MEITLHKLELLVLDAMKKTIAGVAFDQEGKVVLREVIQVVVFN